MQTSTEHDACTITVKLSENLEKLHNQKSQTPTASHSKSSRKMEPLILPKIAYEPPK